MSRPDADPEFAALMRDGLEREERAARVTGRAIFGRLYLAGFFLFSLFPWWSRGSRDGAMSLAIAATMFVTWLAEQLFPARSEWNVRPLSDGRRGWARLLRDLVYLVGITRATSWLLSVVDPPVHAFVQRLGPLSIWPSHAPLAVRIALAFFAVEFFSYWVHRLAHHSRLLWQFHSTHHVITELNAFKSVRTHPLDNLVFHLFRLTPLLLIGAGAEELAAAVYFGALLGILAHANLELGEGVLGWVVNLPRLHAVHHSSALEESRANYGCHTVVWDRLFGTFRRPSEASAPIGVEPLGPRTLWQELAWPLYRWVSEAPAPREEAAR